MNDKNFSDQHKEPIRIKSDGNFLFGINTKNSSFSSFISLHHFFITEPALQLPSRQLIRIRFSGRLVELLAEIKDREHPHGRDHKEDDGDIGNAASNGRKKQD